MAESHGAGLSIRDLRVCFGEVEAVRGVDLEVPAGSFTALLGPSGCGKSTTLAAVAGLLEPRGGELWLDGCSLRGVRAEDRPVSLVFQKPLLFPHLSVAQNVGFGLRMQGTPRGQARAEVGAMLERVRLEGLGARRVGELSGGQEQRVSLARALVLRPRLLLLDEPFSQLDAALRHEMRTLVRELHDESEVTTVFVTHDQDEAVELADEIALMLVGRVAGVGPPEEFYLHPPSLAAARFFGAHNEVAGVVREGCFHSETGSIRVPTSADSGPAVLVVRPEAIGLDPIRGGVPGTVTATRFAGAHVAVEVQLAGGVELRLHAPVGRRVAAGDGVRLELPAQRCSVFPVGGDDES